MIEETSKNAREVVEKFAMDSSSGLEKIKQATQRQFSTGDMNMNTPSDRSAKVILSPDRLQAGSPEKQMGQAKMGLRSAYKCSPTKERSSHKQVALI